MDKRIYTFLKHFNSSDNIDRYLLELLGRTDDCIDDYVNYIRNESNNEYLTGFIDNHLRHKYKRGNNKTIVKIGRNNTLNDDISDTNDNTMNTSNTNIMNTNISSSYKVIPPGLSIDNSLVSDNLHNKISKVRELHTKNVFIPLEDIKDEDELNYSIPYNLYCIYQCNMCGIRYDDKHKLEIHEESHSREYNARLQMNFIIRRGWFKQNDDIVVDTHLSNLLNKQLSIIQRRVGIEHFYLKRYNKTFCIKCKHKINLIYDNRRNKWYLDGGINIGDISIHKKCN